ncbi:MAG: hypothetical protein WCZ21_01015 [Bacteroidales bacterium]
MNIKKYIKRKTLIVIKLRFDKLDDSRMEYLTVMVANKYFGQVFISHTLNRTEALYHRTGTSSRLNVI